MRFCLQGVITDSVYPIRDLHLTGSMEDSKRTSYVPIPTAMGSGSGFKNLAKKARGSQFQCKWMIKWVRVKKGYNI